MKCIIIFNYHIYNHSSQCAQGIKQYDTIVHSNRNIVYSKFDCKGYCGYGFKDWWDYGIYSNDTNSYIDDLKAVASFEGICPDEIDYLAANGFTPEEIEEYIFCYE